MRCGVKREEAKIAIAEPKNAVRRILDDARETDTALIENIESQAAPDTDGRCRRENGDVLAGWNLLDFSEARGDAVVKLLPCFTVLLVPAAHPCLDNL